MRNSRQTEPIAPERIRRILVIRLRSIGDTVLATPTLSALARYVPDARIDVLLEDWVAPVLEGFLPAERIISFRRDDLLSRLGTMAAIRRNRYDLVINLHGGSTSAFFSRVSGAPYRVGFGHYRYRSFYNRILGSASAFWGRSPTHSAEQQLALAGFIGAQVDDLPKSQLVVTGRASAAVSARFPETSRIALLHPVAAFATKEWAARGFAEVADYLSGRGFSVIAVGAPSEKQSLETVAAFADGRLTIADDLSLAEITALAARAGIFVGNDSGIAHIAAAVGTPSVVVFGSSNRDHWHPWTDAPWRIIYEPFGCQPCAGYRCERFDSPKCIESVSAERVLGAVRELVGG